jgi:hypothetical protein
VILTGLEPVPNLFQRFMLNQLHYRTIYFYI